MLVQQPAKNECEGGAAEQLVGRAVLCETEGRHAASLPHAAAPGRQLRLRLREVTGYGCWGEVAG